MQDFRYVGLDIFYASSEHSEIFISVFYPNWLIIRKFYLNLLIVFLILWGRDGDMQELATLYIEYQIKDTNNH